MSYNPKGIGENSEAQIMACFLKHGKVVLQPFGDNQRYDMVVDENGNFIRVQCKTGLMEKRLGGRAFVFPTCSTNWNTRKNKTYEGDADVFAVYLREDDSVYIIPVESAPKKSCIIRMKKSSRHRVAKGKVTRMAEDYIFDPNISLMDYPKGS